jgi:hypothetical protein
MRWALLLFLLSRTPACGAAPPQSGAPDAKPTFTLSQFAPGKPIHLVAYGDMRFTDLSVTTGTNPRVRRWLADQIGREHPEVLLLTGDMPYKGARVSDWMVFQAETASWRANHIVQLPTTGNHEIYDDPARGIANYLKNFPQIAGHRYYSALLGSVEVISLDCNLPAGKTSPQGRWFGEQLDHLPESVEFLFILYHVPWMADEQSQVFANLPSKEALSLRGILEAHLHALHAKVVVFNGHIHNYERFERNGVEYVVSGGGGAEPYPLLFRGSADLYRDSAFPVYHYLTLEVRDHRLHAVMWKVKDPAAAALSVEAKDEFTLTAPERKPGSQPR